MNQEKIGKFLSTLRKEKGLTQEELSEKLRVSNKTISRWENGTTMMDVSLYKEICDIFDISINELLSGERLENDKLKMVSEENILKSLNDNKNDKKKYKYIILTIIVLILIFLLIIFKTIYPKINIYNIDIIKLDETMNYISKKKFEFKDYNVYYYGIDSIRLCDINEKCYLIENAINHNQSNFDNIRNYLEKESNLGNNEKQLFWDGGSTWYFNKNYEVLYCNTIGGNKDVYIGIRGMIDSLQGNYCGFKGLHEKFFIRTYHILSIKELKNDFIDVTLEDYKGVIKTVKFVNGFNLTPGRDYEFKFRTYELFKDTFNNIFKYSELVEVNESLKDKSEQINEKIVYNDGIDNENIENIKMIIKKGTLSNSGATVVITDNSGLDNIYGECYELQILKNDGYVEVDRTVDNVCNDIGYKIGKDKKLELKIDWSYVYGYLPSGKYRIVKNVGSDYHIAAYFELKIVPTTSK